MSRKRLIAPEFFAHGELYDAEVSSGLPLRLAFAGLWTVCDRRGLFTWKPRELKLDILPYDPVDFGAVLLALEAHGFVKRYVVEGRAFGHVPSFKRWQTFHTNEKPSDVPSTVLDYPEPSIGCNASSIGGGESAKNAKQDDSSTTITGTVVSTVAVAVTGAGTVPKNLSHRRKRDVRLNGSAADTPPSKPSRETWLTPVHDAWEAKNGAGTFDLIARQAAGVLAPLRAAGHDSPTIAQYLSAYLEQNEPQYASITRFAQTFEQWKPRQLVDENGLLNEHGLAALGIK